MGVIDEDFGRLAYNLIVVELGVGGYLSGRVELHLVGRGALGLGLDLQVEVTDTLGLMGVRTGQEAKNVRT